MLIDGVMREMYAVFKECQGGELEMLTSNGWDLLACLTREQSGFMGGGQFSMPAGSGNITIPSSVQAVAYLVGKPRQPYIASLKEENSKLHAHISEKLKEYKDLQLVSESFKRDAERCNERFDALSKASHETSDKLNDRDALLRRAQGRLGTERWNELVADSEEKQ